MRRFLAFALLLMGVSLANAQAPTVICTPTTGGSCIPVNAANPLPIAGSFSATLTGFLSNGLFATLTATNTTSASTALPTGATANPSVRITNNGTTVVSCTMATGAATGVANNILVQPGSSVSRVVGTFVNIACIDQTGSVSNPVVIEGGSGLGNDSGGGGSGGGSSSITTWAGGTLGAMANYGTTPGAVLVPGVNSFITNIPPVTQSGVWTDRIVGNAGAIFDFAGQNTASPANALLMGGQFNTTPTTLTNGNSSPFQLDNAGNLLVNAKVVSGGNISNASSAVATSSINQGTIAYNYGFNGATWDQLQVNGSKALQVNDANVLAAVNAGVATPGAAPPANIIAWGALGSGATNGLSRAVINCDQHIFKHIITATDTLAVQGVAAQTIYICSATAQAAGTATYFLENTASVNANCASANTQIGGLNTLVANGQYGFYSALWGGLKNTSGNGLCINSTGTGGFDLDIWFAQF